IELIRTIPAQLRFRFEYRKERTLKVEVPLSGTLPTGYTASVANIDPPYLKIAGPGSRVDAVTTAISDPFDVSHLTNDSEQTLVVYVDEPEVRFLSPPRVKVK